MSGDVPRWRWAWRRLYPRWYKPAAAERDGTGTAKAIPGAPDGGSTDNSMSNQQQQLEMLHYQLMAVYVYAVQTVRGPSRLPQGSEPPPKQQPWVVRLRSRYRRRPPAESSSRGAHPQKARQFYKYRPVTRALVESHIKAKLTELRITYMEIEQSIPDDDSVHAFRIWLRDTQDSVARFSSTLTTLVIVRRMLVALWPLVIALAVVGAVWKYIRNLLDKVMHGNLENFALLALTTMLYILLSLFLAAQKKRAFFLAPISISHIWNSNAWAPSVRSITAKNVYETEDNLFSYIGKAKRPEFPLDSYALGTLGVILALIVLLFIPTIKIGSQQFIFGLLALISLGMAVSTIRQGRRRSLR